MAQQLVIQTAFPGDLFLSIPLLKQLRVYFPDDEIALMCRKGMKDIYLHEKLADHCFEVDKKEVSKNKSILNDIKAQDWQRVICPHESYRSAFLVRSLKVREEAVGFKKYWNAPFFTRRVRKNYFLPDALRQLSLLAAVSPQFEQVYEGAGLERFNNRSDRFAVTYQKECLPEWASMRLKTPMPSRDRQTVFLAPGSVWPTKRWTLDGYVDLAKALVRRGDEAVLVGSPAEAELCETIQSQVPEARNTAGKTNLMELVDLLTTGHALVCNDSGAMHAAAVAGLPTVAIFGPTTLDLGFRPWQSRATVVQVDLNCRPCGKHGGKKCPIGTHQCMKDITAETVLKELDRLILPSAL